MNPKPQPGRKNGKIDVRPDAGAPLGHREAPPISLHILAVRPARGGSSIDAVLAESFSTSLVTRTSHLAEAARQIGDGVFDLVVIAANPFKAGHGKIAAALRDHPTSMPTVWVLGSAGEDALLAVCPQPLPGWEMVAGEGLTDGVLKARLEKAIQNHQRHWELTHLHKAFQSSLIQYRNLFDEVPDLIFMCDRSGCLLDVNATAVRLFGRSKEKLLMQPIFETFGIQVEDFQHLLDRALASEGPIEDFEIEFRPPGSASIFGLTHLIRWQTAPGRPLQFQGVIKDISPHKRLESQLRHSEEKYKTLYELARICSSSLQINEVAERSLERIQRCCRAEGIMLLLNRRFEELNLLAARDFPSELNHMFQRSKPPVIGQDLIGRWAITTGMHQLADPDSPALHPALRHWMMSAPGQVLIGCTLARGNPTVPAGVLLLLMSAASEAALDRDLLDGLAKTLEMGLTNCFHYANSQEAEVRYRELWENAPAFFFSIMRGGEIFEVNQTAARALNYKLVDLIGQPFAHFVEPEHRAAFEEHHRELIAEGKPQSYELVLRRRDGQAMSVAIKSEPIVNREGETIGEKSVIHDITRDKELEARLRDYADNLERMVQERTLELTQTMNFLNGILEGATEYAILGLDEHGGFLHFNRGAQLLFGHEAGEMVNRQDFACLIDFELVPWRDLGELLETIDSQGVLVQEIPMKTSDGRFLTALLTINRLRSHAASNLSYVAIARDITEQKELEELVKLYTEGLQQVVEQKTQELERQHVQLIQSSKLATLGEMATGIAHELNQPLSGIRTRAQLVSKSLERNMVHTERIASNQTEIVQLVDRITRIINHMRIFARQDQQNFAPFRISQSIDGALSLMGEQLRIHGIEVEHETSEHLPLTFGEPLQIEQVILNLLSNARDAIDARAEDERLHGNGSFDKRLRLSAETTDAGELCLTVSDNGSGMPEDTKTKVFEPFFTTKPVGRGTGLGLSISYGIVANHKGRFEVESQPGVGTTFRIYLPVWNRENEEAVSLRARDAAS